MDQFINDLIVVSTNDSLNVYNPIPDYCIALFLHFEKKLIGLESGLWTSFVTCINFGVMNFRSRLSEITLHAFTPRSL